MDNEHRHVPINRSVDAFEGIKFTWAKPKETKTELHTLVAYFMYFDRITRDLCC